MSHDFKRIVNRNNLYSVKWKKAYAINSEIGEQLPPFSVADLDFKYPTQLINKFEEYVSEMVFGYTLPGDSYYASFIDWVNRRHHVNISRDWIVDGNGVVSGIYTSIRAFSNINDGVIVMTPVYPPFTKSIVDTNRTVVNVPLLLNEGRYCIDFELFEKVCRDENNKLFIMCSPHNPVGRVWTKGELLEIERITREHDVIVISDEIHMDILISANIHTMYLSLNKYSANNSVTLTSASKSFNLAGAQTSMAIIPSLELRKKFQDEMLKGPAFAVNSFGFKLAEIAYEECEDWFDELLDLISYNHEYLKAYINDNIVGIKVMPLEGSYLQWLDFSGLNMTEEELSEFLDHTCGLILVAGSEYGEGGENYFRWNIATPTKHLSASLKRLSDGVNRLNKSI